MPLEDGFRLAGGKLLPNMFFFRISGPKEICLGVMGMVGAGMRRGISCSLKWEELTA